MERRSALSREQAKQLLALAKEQLPMAYAPYSQFWVGAALLAASGSIYMGCNIENAAYTPGNCAERTAFFQAVSRGEREFVAICVVGGHLGHIQGLTPPCGVCRQVMMEFCSPDFLILLSGDGQQWSEHRLGDMLPLGFGPGTLQH